MTRKPHETWPPLIVASDKPRWVTWRDFGLTLIMWVMFAIMLETEFELFFGRYLENLGLGDFQTEANWDVFFQRLRPYIGLVIILLVTLIVSTVATLQRVRRAIRMHPPAPLPIEIDSPTPSLLTVTACLASAPVIEIRSPTAADTSDSSR